MKKVLSLLLSLLMLASVMTAIPFTAPAADSGALDEVVAADRFVKAYKALDKLYHSYDAKTEKQFTKGEYTFVRYRMKGRKFNTKKKVMAYLKKYFSKAAAAQIYKDKFTEKNGKLYITFYLYGYDSALVINDVYAKKVNIGQSKTVVTFGLLWQMMDEEYENTSVKLRMVYENGRWVFAKNNFWRGDSYANVTVITPGDGK